MARVKGGSVSKTRRRKVLKQAKGYFGSKHRLYKTAQEQVFHSGAYAYRDRRQKKRDFRKLWITRINAACRENDISYSRFMNGLSIAGIEINRKMLSELAIDNPKAFSELVEVSKKALLGGKKSEVKETSKKEEKVEVKEEVKKDEKASKSEAKDYSKMTLAELKAIAKEQGVKGYSSMKKDDLIANLK
ncbi:TPA: 50S ribosomal protein L20 [Candidatus Ventrenecus avicola]|nr:50S ribosomal protein L20 [Candidatus Ventrenecus avicola]